jgi:hypothetical protein
MERTQTDKILAASLQSHGLADHFDNVDGLQNL